MVLAVLETRCGVTIGANDVYLNVAGGLRINEPGADLAVAAALISSLTGVPVPADAVLFGEIGLSGEVRAVTHTDLRLKEAAKLGFTHALIPKANAPKGKIEGIEIMAVDRVEEAMSWVRNHPGS